MLQSLEPAAEKGQNLIENSQRLRVGERDAGSLKEAVADHAKRADYGGGGEQRADVLVTCVEISGD